MNINALWLLIRELEPEYFHLINEASNCFLQEIMDPISFNDEELPEVSCAELLDEIENILNRDLAMVAQACTIEFCITNEYIVEGEAWNCIAHIFEHHRNLLTSNSRKYLNALNNSYMGIYKVLSVEPNISITLKDMLEPNNRDYRVLSKNLSKVITANQIIATRLLKIEQAKPSEYHLSNSLVFLPEGLDKECIGNIQMLTAAMNQPCILILSLANNYKILGALSRKLVYCNQP